MTNPQSLLSTLSFPLVLTIFSLVLFFFRFHSHIVYRLHRVAALKIMYFRGRVGRTFFSVLRESRFTVCGHLSPSDSLFSFLSRARASFTSFSLFVRELRCNNGCPLIIGRPRHFKEKPRAHHETAFRSVLKISFSSFFCSLCLSLFLSRERARFNSSVTKKTNKNKQNNQRSFLALF